MLLCNIFISFFTQIYSPSFSVAGGATVRMRVVRVDSLRIRLACHTTAISARITEL